MVILNIGMHGWRKVMCVCIGMGARHMKRTPVHVDAQFELCLSERSRNEIWMCNDRKQMSIINEVRTMAKEWIEMHARIHSSPFLGRIKRDPTNGTMHEFSGAC